MGIRIISSSNSIPQVLSELKKLKKYNIEVGIFGSDDSFYAMIANVHEFGITIYPKNVKYLTVPVSPKAKGKRAADFPNIFRPKGKKVLAIPKGDNGYEVLFALKDSVKIPERSFLRSTFDEQNDKWFTFLKKQVANVLNGRIGAKTLCERLGAKMVADIQEKLTDLDDPPNVSATTATKGSTNPLLDTGGLRMRVTYKVVRS